MGQSGQILSRTSWGNQTTTDGDGRDTVIRARVADAARRRKRELPRIWTDDTDGEKRFLHGPPTSHAGHEFFTTDYTDIWDYTDAEDHSTQVIMAAPDRISLPIRVIQNIRVIRGPKRPALVYTRQWSAPPCPPDPCNPRHPSKSVVTPTKEKRAARI